MKKKKRKWTNLKEMVLTQTSLIMTMKIRMQQNLLRCLSVLIAKREKIKKTMKSSVRSFEAAKKLRKVLMKIITVLRQITTMKMVTKRL